MFYSRIISFMMLGEILFISLQAMRAERSHFNDSPMGSIIYGLMGAMILISTVATLLLVWPYFRSSARQLSIGHSLLQGIRMGAGIFFLGSVAGGVMSSMMTHSVGEPAGGTIPFLGWSTNAGDIRAVHFLGLHAIQVLPLLGWLAHTRGWPGWVVNAGSAVYGLLFAVLSVLTAAGLSVVYWL